eukprot:COSAG03_NODE_936_length_5265_cov_20.249322_5_plen_122_part_00
MPYGSSPSPPLDPSLWHGPLSSVPYGSCPSLSLPNLLGTTPNSSAMGAGHSLKPHSVPCRGFGQQPFCFADRGIDTCSSNVPHHDRGLLGSRCERSVKTRPVRERHTDTRTVLLFLWRFAG